MEILSPSSNMEHIDVAIDCKSNAVYGGLKNWNARNKTINFTTEEYNLLIDKLHINGIKFYLTLNILLLDEEIDDIINFLKNNKLPDAFIVTDMGLISELKKEFPEIPLHFSTQFGAHNIDDVNYIKSLNGERAILSRELTLDEINKIKETSSCELECFIWGSQCLSFSGLCFFGTLINGGGGNRGKCIITCRDIYSINHEKGHYLYVPDMDCINLISKLDGIDCLKIEGRRRNPKEIKKVLKQINNNIHSINNAGYLYGTTIEKNNLSEKINKRSNPIMKANKLENINQNDICFKFNNGLPIEISNNYLDSDVMYVYTEIKKDYDINKKNLSFDLNIKNNIMEDILYLNYKGNGNTFFGKDNDYIEIKIDEFIKYIESKNNKINIYKVKYKRENSNPILISKKLYDEVIEFVINDCKEINYEIKNNKIKLKNIYLETNKIEIIEKFIEDKFIKIIYNIESINNLKNIEKIIKKFNDKIIYKLPIFNWNSENILPYLKQLENKEIMFTRFTQIYLCKNLKFKKKYADYTIYVWNKRALKYLNENNIDEVTASFELSYNTNKKILNNIDHQVILCGKVPLVYTRNCFKNLFNCSNCIKNRSNCKSIKNEDKNLDFEIYCNSDYRYILYNKPILNNYSKVDVLENTKFRYVTSNEDINIIEETINELKKDNYYKNLKKLNYWKNSYECNLLKGKE